MMAVPRNFSELAIQRMEELSGETAYQFVRAGQDGERLEADSLTYGELGRRALRLAAWLQDRGCHGQRVLILHTDGQQFAASFLGCLLAGAVAVPAPPPSGARQNIERVANIVKDAAVSYLMTDSAHASGISQLLASIGHSEVVCLATDRAGHAAASEGAESGWHEPGLYPDDVAYLQYTSGSVSDPKGVMITHRNMLANQEAIQQAMRTGTGSVVGGWLPFHHDMGLAGHLLHPLWLGSRGVLM